MRPRFTSALFLVILFLQFAGFASTAALPPHAGMTWQRMSIAIGRRMCFTTCRIVEDPANHDIQPVAATSTISDTGSASTIIDDPSVTSSSVAPVSTSTSDNDTSCSTPECQVLSESTSASSVSASTPSIINLFVFGLTGASLSVLLSFF
ncbi:uncharacterized protein STEHIDRAFT_171730 [Stereum hirsutum FP-91666 SS1]|uniref:uncharacterized protein n=1 Tax=Stereum hirsutum (strain FP-91666) TaxID=721885 RepID=UPI000444A0EE|nr:uncharacterized protein STEHIDRAFT_171730 [Stereum hirsutum FP-91666 SS1]EIM82162.1 hypothetical protein STEHIDRAFT_171730 [Stereum hirsutum FP-91666 SS1]